jgi:hypothetical protein
MSFKSNTLASDTNTQPLILSPTPSDTLAEEVDMKQFIPPAGIKDLRSILIAKKTEELKKLLSTNNTPSISTSLSPGLERKLSEANKKRININLTLPNKVSGSVKLRNKTSPAEDETTSSETTSSETTSSEDSNIDIPVMNDIKFMVTPPEEAIEK